jgi:lysozyme|tara:strand:+ start:621 stop:1064 length:444 start_codon:yes stop_codon:yes gene_type:complete
MNDQLEQKVSHLLRLHEGFVSHVYEDSTPEKYLTIGYGRLVDERLGGGISQDEAEYLLMNDIRNCIKILASRIETWESLSETRKIVLINMYFNLGNRLFNFKNMLAALHMKDYDEVANQMLDSKWAEQVKGRANELAGMMKSDIFHS